MCVHSPDLYIISQLHLVRQGMPDALFHKAEQQRAHSQRNWIQAYLGIFIRDTKSMKNWIE